MEIIDLLPSWQRSLRAVNRRPRTIETYSEALVLFDRFLREHDMPADAADIERKHVEAFIDDQLNGVTATGKTRTPATAAGRFRYLQQFWRWASDEGECDVNPIKGMSPPKIPETPVPVLDGDTIKALLKVCEGRGFTERRDTAIIRVFLSTGCRLAELTGLTLDDLNLETEHPTADVVGKGGKERFIPLNPKTAEALDRYLRIRTKHPQRHDKALWLGPKGPLTSSGVAQLLRRRCRQAGVPALHPHQFRHTFAHLWQAQRGGDGNLERLMGWSKGSGMTRRYGASAADARAHDAARHLAIGDDY